MSQITRVGAFIAVAVIFFLPMISTIGNAAELYPLPLERYKKNWCAEHHGATEVRTPDGNTADCITSTHVVEFQYAPKWTEVIGQALYYSQETGKKAGIVLIIEDQKEMEHWKRLNSTIKHFKLPIDTWKIE